MTDLTRVTYPYHGANGVNAAMDELFAIFPDQYPKLIYEVDEGWVLELDWPVVPEWYVDKGVMDQSKALLGLNPSQVASYYQESKLGQSIDFVLSMFHSRAIIAATRANKRLSSVLKIIVHIDDHDDLMPSILYPSNKTVFSKFGFDGNLKFDDVESVLSAINKGYINMGNFLTTYLLFNPRGTLIVVNPEKDKQSGWLYSENTKLPYAKGTVNHKVLFLSDTRKVESWWYERTPVVPNSIAGDDKEKIWLDIDLDVFCNRFERDSDLKDRKGNPKEKVGVLSKVNKVFEELKEALWLHRVEAVSISISPGFFPSEYWSEIVPETLNRITKLFQGSV